MRLALAFALVLAPAGMTCALAQPSYEEDNVKAAFLLRFADFVQWPAKSLPDDTTTLQFGIAGADAVAAVLSQLAGARGGNQRPVAVRSVEPGPAVQSLHVLYIPAAQKEKLPQYLAAVSGRPVLVVTDFADALEHGSTINFLIVQQRVRFEISLDAAEAARLRISSRLLAVAMRVNKSDTR